MIRRAHLKNTPDAHTVAYLTSVYARATDTFIRDEVATLRALGDDVRTYSVRKPLASEVVNPAIEAERDATTYLLDLPRTSLLSATATVLVRSPRRFFKAAAAACRLGRPGLKGQLWPVFYFIEACALAVHLQKDRVDHLHNHIGEGSASVAMLTSLMTGIPYSFTVHGPSEWDAPMELALDLKAQHAAFVVAISEYTRGQVRRWSKPEDWSKVHVVHCGVRIPTNTPAAIPTPRAELRVLSVGRLAPEKGSSGAGAGLGATISAGTAPRRDRRRRPRAVQIGATDRALWSGPERRARWMEVGRRGPCGAARSRCAGHAELRRGPACFDHGGFRAC